MKAIRERFIFMLPLFAMLAAWLLPERTAAYALCAGLAAGFIISVVCLARRCLPNAQTLRVRRLSAALFSGAGFALIAFYLWHFANAQTVFINDDSLYYYQQLALSEHLHGGLLDTLRHTYASLSTDYTSIPNLILAPLFSLTDRSIEGFGLAVTAMVWPLTLYQLRRITLSLADRLCLTETRTLLLCTGVCVSVFALPLLHRAALWRQVNLLGLPMMIQIVVLALGVDFRRPDLWRLLSLFLTSILLSLTRRWFLFFLAGFLLVWGGMTLVPILRQKEWTALRRFVLYALGSAMLGLLLLYPMLRRAIEGNYTVSYAYWRKEGSALAYELWNQSWLVGWGSCGMIAAGYAWGLLQHRSPLLRRLTAMVLISSLISLVLFTRIQNMTYHQATLLFPAYMLGMLLFFAMLASIQKRSLRCGLSLLTMGALMLQWGLCVTHDKPQQLSPLLSHVSLKPPVRDDLGLIAAVSDFIDETCDAAHPALILCNSSDFDRLTFVNLRYPDLTLRSKVALDRIALPSDGFPRAWFSARYILVPTVPQTNQPGSTVEKLTQYLLADEADRFETVASFPFNSFNLLVLRRRGPVEYDEVEELLALFAEEHALYPKVYGDRIGFFYGLAIE